MAERKGTGIVPLRSSIMSKRNLYRVESAKNAARITMLLEAGARRDSEFQHRDSNARDSYPESPTYGDGNRMQPISRIHVEESTIKQT